MAKEVISINKDDDEVNIRVPSFQNLGARMGALERQSFEAQFGPQGDNATSPTTDQAADTESQMAELNAMLADLVSTQKEALKQLPPEFSGLMSGFITEMENLDYSKLDSSLPLYEEKDFECFNYDLQDLSVRYPEGSEWDSTLEARLDRFLAEWPGIRPQVLLALCKRYEEMYPQFQDFADPILFPAPGGPELMDDRARITTIYLREDGLIGLSGECTWEDEHGLGVLIEDGKVIDCGYADVADEERYEEEDDE